MNKKLLIVVLLLIPIAVISFMKDETNFSLAKEEKENQDIIVRLKQTETDKVIEIPVEEYLIGVVAAEMPASFLPEALKAQAIASRSFALSHLNNKKTYDVVDTTDSQAHITKEQMQEKWKDDYDKYYQIIKEAVEQTKGLVITYDNKIIMAYYFSMSNGYTEDSSYVFNESKDYLHTVESSWDNESLKNYEVETVFSQEEFCKKINIENTPITVTDIRRTESNRVQSIKINDKKYTGIELRKLLGLRSTDFVIQVEENSLLITTRGYGHGVGMSQYGANGMAKEGKTHQEILAYYYKNTKIEEYHV